MAIIQIKRTNVANYFDTTYGLQQGELGVDLTKNKLYCGTDGTYTGNRLLNPDGGTADTAAKLSVPREIALAGMATGSTNFDGSQNVTINVTLAQVGTASEKLYAVATDAYGRVISGITELQITDITGLENALTQNLTNAKNYTDTEITSAKNELIGTSTTGATATTIKGAVDESKGYTDTQINEKISSVYKPSGTLAFASLPAPSADLLGNVYNVSDAFTTDDQFVEGEGLSFPAGTNVVVIETTDSAYKYDVLAGFISLDDYLTTTEASATYATQETVNGIQSTVTEIQGDVSELTTSVTNITNALGGEIPENIVTSVTAGNGVEISGDGKDLTIQAKVVIGNGLNLNSNGISMAEGSNTSKGVLQVDGTSIVANSGIISVSVIDGGIVSAG